MDPKACTQIATRATGLKSSDSERAEIDGRIRALEKDITDLKSQRNELAPIFRLPPEILSNILIFHAQAYWPATNPRNWIKATTICTHWRHVALGCPQLWSEVDFNFPKMAPLMLERSKQMPVTLTIPNHVPATAQQHVDGILSQPHRFQSLDMTTNSEAAQTLVQTSFVSPAPYLQTLSLAANSNLVLPENLFSGDAPNLRELRLTGWIFPWTSPLLCSGLTALKLVSCPSQHHTHPPFHPADFVGAVDRMRSLRTLDLHIDLPFINTPETHVAHMPQLDKFRFKGSFKHCADILKKLVLPTSANLHLRCAITRGEEESSISDLVSAIGTAWLSMPASSPSTRRNPERATCIRSLQVSDARLDGWLNPMPEKADAWAWDRGIHSQPFGIIIQVTGWDIDHTSTILSRLLSELPLDDVEHLSVDRIERTEPPLERLVKLPKVTSVWATRHNVAGLLVHLSADPAMKSGKKGGISNPPKSITYLPNATTLFINEVNFSGAYGSNITVDRLIDLLILRYESGAELQNLSMRECVNLFKEDVARIREVVVNVEWDGFELTKNFSDYEEEGYQDEDEDDYDDYPGQGNYYDDDFYNDSGISDDAW